jgi:hypothetical protein
MAMPKRMLQGKIYTTRKLGRPRLRRLEDVHDDLRKMKVKGWGGLMKNRGRLFRRPKLTLSCSAERKGGRKEVPHYLKEFIFWDGTPCGPLKVNRRFRGTCRNYLQQASHFLLVSCLAYTTTLEMEATCLRHIGSH